MTLVADGAPEPQPDVPTIDVDYQLDRPIFWHAASLDALREASPVARNTQCGGFWMINRYEDARRVLLDHETFTNATISPFNPEQKLRLIPQVLDPPEQIAYRRLLNPWFSPGAVKARSAAARKHCEALVEALEPAGESDFVNDFGLRFPTDIFLQILGLPTEDSVLFLPWLETIFAGFFGGDTTAMGDAIGAIYRYFEDRLVERESDPQDPQVDFISYLSTTELHGEPLTRDDLLTVCMTLCLAGLDTTRAQLGYIFHHLACHPDDRAALIDRPELIPSAVEEFLRLYTLVLTAGRRVASPVEVAGCPMAAGDVVWVGVMSANRDPRVFADPERYDPERAPNPHVAFGAGAHRCLGMHLARAELIIAIEEWHARIPDYEMAVGADDLIERGGQLTLRTLPLRWSPVG